MKNLKKLSGILLAIAVLLACTVSAFAESGTSGDAGKITITNTVKTKSYSIYKILVLESFNDNPNTTPPVDPAYSYKFNDETGHDWSGLYEFSNPEGSVQSYLHKDENDYVTWVGDQTEARAAAFAKLAKAYLAAHNEIQADATKTSDGDNTDVVFDTNGLGYYLVTSGLGAVCSLTTTNKKVTIAEKNAAPTLVKEVKEDGDWVTTNDANIGDTVEFKATITVFGIAKDYVLYDTMDDGFTYTAVTGVTKNDSNLADSDYTVNKTGDHSFNVTFDSTFCSNLASGDKIVVYYKATINANAKIGNATGNVNTAKLDYADKNGVQSSVDNKTTTYTWGFPVLKYANGEKADVLPGAQFSLYRDIAETKIVNFIQIGATTEYRVATPAEVTADTDLVPTITTGNTGKFTVKGLDSGVYYLKEVKAPDGYNQLETKVKVTIDNNGTVKIGDSATTVEVVEVNNNSGTRLPSTGGIGTTIFYIVGGVLVAAAVVLLVAKKRTSENR